MISYVKRSDKLIKVQTQGLQCLCREYWYWVTNKYYLKKYYWVGYLLGILAARPTSEYGYSLKLLVKSWIEAFGFNQLERLIILNKSPNVMDRQEGYFLLKYLKSKVFKTKFVHVENLKEANNYFLQSNYDG